MNMNSVPTETTYLYTTYIFFPVYLSSTSMAFKASQDTCWIWLPSWSNAHVTAATTEDRGGAVRTYQWRLFERYETVLVKTRLSKLK